VYTELLNVSDKPHTVVAVIRIVDGKLHLTADEANSRRDNHLQEEYAFFKAKVKGDDQAFLKDHLSFVFERNMYLRPVFHPEG